MSKSTTQTAEASSIAALFPDPDASSVITIAAQQIAGPVVRGEDLTADELMTGGGLRVVHYVLDRSPSMEPVGDMLREDFNTELVPAIKDARQDDISALRVGGTSFSWDITPIWVTKGNAYHSLDNLPDLTRKEYDPSQGNATALHQAIIDGTARATKYAAQVEKDTGIAPDIDIVVLSDGANNCPPMGTDDVQQVIASRDKTRVRYVFFYFQTDQGLKDPKSYAMELGFDGENVEVFAAKAGENATDRRKRFRRMLRIMSKVSASKGTSAVQAAAATAAAASTSGDEDVI